MQIRVTTYCSVVSFLFSERHQWLLTKQMWERGAAYHGDQITGIGDNDGYSLMDFLILWSEIPPSAKSSGIIAQQREKRGERRDGAFVYFLVWS